MFTKVQATVDIYPNNVYSPCYPFSGFVININARTQTHRDAKDQEGCLLLCIGHYEGGGLILVEGKLVVETDQGVLIVFPFGHFTHLNEHYVGFRSSIVIHSDNSGWSYQTDGNAWDHNKFFSSCTIPQCI